MARHNSFSSPGGKSTSVAAGMPNRYSSSANNSSQMNAVFQGQPPRRPKGRMFDVEHDSRLRPYRGVYTQSRSNHPVPSFKKSPVRINPNKRHVTERPTSAASSALMSPRVESTFKQHQVDSNLWRLDGALQLKTKGANKHNQKVVLNLPSISLISSSETSPVDDKRYNFYTPRSRLLTDSSPSTNKSSIANIGEGSHLTSFLMDQNGNAIGRRGNNRNSRVRNDLGAYSSNDQNHIFSKDDQDFYFNQLHCRKGRGGAPIIDNADYIGDGYIGGGNVHEDPKFRKLCRDKLASDLAIQVEEKKRRDIQQKLAEKAADELAEKKYLKEIEELNQRAEGDSRAHGANLGDKRSSKVDGFPQVNTPVSKTHSDRPSIWESTDIKEVENSTKRKNSKKIIDIDAEWATYYEKHPERRIGGNYPDKTSTECTVRTPKEKNDNTESSTKLFLPQPSVHSLSRISTEFANEKFDQSIRAANSSSTDFLNAKIDAFSHQIDSELFDLKNTLKESQIQIDNSMNDVVEYLRESRNYVKPYKAVPQEIQNEPPSNLWAKSRDNISFDFTDTNNAVGHSVGASPSFWLKDFVDYSAKIPENTRSTLKHEEAPIVTNRTESPNSQILFNSAVSPEYFLSGLNIDLNKYDDSIPTPIIMSPIDESPFNHQEKFDNTLTFSPTILALTTGDALNTKNEGISPPSAISNFDEDFVNSIDDSSVKSCEAALDVLESALMNKPRRIESGKENQDTTDLLIDSTVTSANIDSELLNEGSRQEVKKTRKKKVVKKKKKHEPTEKEAVDDVIQEEVIGE